MLQECVDVFEAELKSRGEQWLLDQYVPKDGTYILINMENDFQIEKILDIRMDQESGTVSGSQDLDYQFISFLDYYSKLLKMNKRVDPSKIIHSNNFYSFWVKNKNLQGKLSHQSIEGYYSVLREPLKKYGKSSDKSLYLQIEEELGPVDEQRLENIYQWVKGNWQKWSDMEEIDISRKEDYLKVFFIGNNREETRKRVKNEGRRYLQPNIYIKGYNQRCKQGIKGLPGNNMGLNSKKPYMENKSRKIKASYMLDLNHAVLQGQFFDYLAGQASRGKYDIYVDLDEQKILPRSRGEVPPELDNGIYLRIQPGKELEIHNVLRVVNLRNTLKTGFRMKEIIEIPEKAMEKFESGYGKKNRLDEIESLVDDVCFSKALCNNYFTKPEDLSLNDSVRKNALLVYRERLWNWFHAGNEAAVKEILDKMMEGLLLETMQKPGIKPKHQINLWISLTDYFNDNRRCEESMSDVRAQLKGHIDCKEEWQFSGDEEYYYAVGQMVSVFLNLSKAQKKDMSFVNPVLNAKSDKVIKERMLALFKRYGYAIEDRQFRIKELYGHIMRYVPEGRVNGFMVSAGAVDSLLIYEKKSPNAVGSEGVQG